MLRPAAVLAALISLVLASSAFAAPPSASASPEAISPAPAQLLTCRSAAWLAATADITQPLCPPSAGGQPRLFASTFRDARPSPCQVQIGPGTVLDRQWVYAYRRLEKKLGMHCDIVHVAADSRDELDGR